MHLINVTVFLRILDRPERAASTSMLERQRLFFFYPALIAHELPAVYFDKIVLSLHDTRPTKRLN